MMNRVRAATRYFGIYYTLLLVVVSFWFYQLNQPYHIEVPLLATGKLQCVSYAPYYGEDQSPFVPGMMIESKQIDADLKRLSKISNCVRTYSVGQGMDYVPEAASKLGLKVYLGAWVGWTHKDNVAEINLAVDKANHYPDTVLALVIGNEVLLRKEQDEQAMKRYIDLARRQTAIPITYADVWEYWIKHRDMEKYVDFITVHILPYWEDNPVSIENAPRHAEQVMTKLNTIFSKPIFIGETGWPSVGRQRNESKPSLVNQARYVRTFLQEANEKKWQYNLIEAIDQPWKRVLEGTVGGYWGILDVHLNQKFSFSEAVAERTDGKMPLYFSVCGMLLFLLTANYLKQKNNNILIGLAALGGLTGLSAYLQYAYLVAAARDWIEWSSLGGLALLGMMLSYAQVWWLTCSTTQLQRFISIGRKLLLYAAIVASYLIATDGRYRDFPILLFALPVSVLTLGLWLSAPVKCSNSRVNLWVCVFAVLMAACCWLLELRNVSAMIWLVLNIALALANWPLKILNAGLKNE